jgi:hypothetical protein
VRTQTSARIRSHYLAQLVRADAPASDSSHRLKAAYLPSQRLILPASAVWHALSVRHLAFSPSTAAFADFCAALDVDPAAGVRYVPPRASPPRVEVSYVSRSRDLEFTLVFHPTTSEGRTTFGLTGERERVLAASQWLRPDGEARPGVTLRGFVLGRREYK